jgi:hypothetical protein
MAQRKVRIGGEIEKTIAVGGRTVDALLKEGKKVKYVLEDVVSKFNAKQDISNELTEFVDSINSKELVRLIDESTARDQQQKELAKEVEIAKLILMAKAIQNGLKNFAGENGMVEIKSSESTKMEATALAELLRNEGKTSLFNNLVSVKVGEVKKVMGEDAIKSYSTKTFTEYASVSLKPLKK